MKYIRNSGSKKKKPDKETKKDKSLTLSTVEENKLIAQLIADAKWIKALNEKEQFSKEWIQEILLELLMQCMGKKDILTTNMFGTQIVARMFKEKGAIQVASILAKMEGHLFDTVKGTVKQTAEIEHTHKLEIELKPDSSRTDSVLNILDVCGAFNPLTKRLTKDDVEIISA